MAVTKRSYKIIDDELSRKFDGPVGVEVTEKDGVGKVKLSFEGLKDIEENRIGKISVDKNDLEAIRRSLKEKSKALEQRTRELSRHEAEEHHLLGVSIRVLTQHMDEGVGLYLLRQPKLGGIPEIHLLEKDVKITLNPPKEGYIDITLHPPTGQNTMRHEGYAPGEQRDEDIQLGGKRLTITRDNLPNLGAVQRGSITVGVNLPRHKMQENPMYEFEPGKWVKTSSCTAASFINALDALGLKSRDLNDKEILDVARAIRRPGETFLEDRGGDIHYTNINLIDRIAPRYGARVRTSFMISDPRVNRQAFYYELNELLAYLNESGNVAMVSDNNHTVLISGGIKDRDGKITFLMNDSLGDKRTEIIPENLESRLRLRMVHIIERASSSQ